MPFTFIESSIGGTLIGIAVIAQAVLHGRVTGISGMLSSCILSPFTSGKSMKDSDFRRQLVSNALYVVGLFTAGFLLKGQFHTDQSISQSDATGIQSWILSLIIGTVVGLGTKVLCGCTSGFMICGVARLSKRAIIGTAVFCITATALVQLNLSPMTKDLLVESNAPFLSFPSLYQIMLIFGLMSVITLVHVFLFARAINHNNLGRFDRLEYVSVFWNAFTFGCGLVISGMTNPLKVLGFFAFGRVEYDPSLFCVALFAIFPAMLVFQLWILPQSRDSHKTCLYQRPYQMPTATEITPQLIVGAILFGIGWGLGGVCPGPAIVNAGGLQSTAWMWLVGFAAGAFGSQFVIPLF